MIDTFALAQRRRARAIRALQDTLTLEGMEPWQDLPVVLARSLAEDELGLLALCALMALPDEYAVAVVQRALGEMGEVPDVWLGSPERATEALARAREWAREATQIEVKAMAMACVDRMPPKTRAGFADWVRPPMKVAAE